MLKRCDDKTMAAGTIAAGALGEPYAPAECTLAPKKH
jgi:hypothetical protein